MSVIYNENKIISMWTKEDNKQLRQLNKEGKTADEIISIMGEKLKDEPNHKYVYRYNEFILNEIFTKPTDTSNYFAQEKSEVYPDEWNYSSMFKTDSGQKYVVDFIYVKETKNQFKNSNVFNLSFTTVEQHDMKDYKKYEMPTKKNEHIELMKRLLFVIDVSLYNIKRRYPNPIILLGETENPQKIKFYRNVIKDSLPNVTEVEDMSEFTNGLKAYYYIIK
jgi:hypothetical protein